MVIDDSALRSEYRLAIVHEVFPGKDGKVRRVNVSYRSYKVSEKVQEYHGSSHQIISRSVQRLVLLVPVDFNPEKSSDDLIDSLPKT